MVFTALPAPTPGARAKVPMAKDTPTPPPSASMAELSLADRLTFPLVAVTLLPSVINAVTVLLIVLPDPAPKNANATPTLSPTLPATPTPPAIVRAQIEFAPAVGGLVLALRLTLPAAFTVALSMFASTVSVIVSIATEMPTAGETWKPLPHAMANAAVPAI